MVDTTKREALVWAPKPGDTPAPVVFVFHGHGGSMRQAANSIAVHEAWPEALVVFMQGLPTPGRLADPKGERSGWQAGPAQQGDRDLRFFDLVWASLRAEHRVDLRRVYATGHSNGGAFTYLLWATRAEHFTAFGPSAAVPSWNFTSLPPKPVIHVAGEKDPLVKFAWQERMIGYLRRLHNCESGKTVGDRLTLYASPLRAPVLTYVHPGGHGYPSEATALIVQFFKQQTRIEPGEGDGITCHYPDLFRSSPTQPSPK